MRARAALLDHLATVPISIDPLTFLVWQALFLFNYNTRQLHGVFVRNGPAALNLEPEAWAHHRKPGDRVNESPYPAQVRWQPWCWCKPLAESVWSDVPTLKPGGSGPGRKNLYEMWMGREQAQKLATLFLRHG